MLKIKNNRQAAASKNKGMRAAWIVAHYQKNIIKTKEFKRIMEEQKKYLIPGKYQLVNNRRAMMILRDHDLAKSFMEANTSHMLRTSVNKMEKIKKHVRNLIDASFRLELKPDGDQKYQGSLIMLTGSGNIKIFDFSNNQVLTVLKDSKEYEKKKDVYFKFRDYFRIPETSFMDNESMIIEKRIELIPYEKLSNKMLQYSIEKVLSDYKEYFAKLQDTKVELYRKSEILADLTFVEDESFRNLLSEIITENKKEWEIPRVEVHGDLNYQNILLDKNNLYYIDWEFSKPLVFFFDIFNLMFIEASTYANYSYTDKYVQGGYDRLLSEIFALFAMEFDPRKRMFYLSVYLIDCMKNKDPFVYLDDYPQAQLQYYHTLLRINKRRKKTDKP